ncbi:11 kDa protein [Blackcurrant-associated closterovirus 1]|uniref:11 kDa protein n=1 Tax=Blackcurrant closterovirus 1 TaxID=2734344 RepID=A0A385L386_9CLOS|nr:11 kDa protein [Blackcurrant-associated closterovirus 1]AYA22231.1 11 kDa protein [Blackcurrant-associated closterovirus 1]
MQSGESVEQYLKRKRDDLNEYVENSRVHNDLCLHKLVGIYNELLLIVSSCVKVIEGRDHIEINRRVIESSDINSLVATLNETIESLAAAKRRD